MSQKIWSCSLSAILLMICIVFGAVKGKDCLGMDFTGGSSISYLVNKGDISFREVEGVVNKLSLTQKATVQEVAESTDSSKVNILINFPTMPRTRRLSPRHWTRRFRFWTTLRSVKKPSGSPWGTIRSLLPHGPFSSAFWESWFT